MTEEDAEEQQQNDEEKGALREEHCDRTKNKDGRWEKGDNGVAELSWQVLSRAPSGDWIARFCRHTGPDLTVKIGVQNRNAKLLLSQYVWGFWGPFQTV